MFGVRGGRAVDAGGGGGEPGCATGGAVSAMAIRFRKMSRSAFNFWRSALSVSRESSLPAINSRMPSRRVRNSSSLSFSAGRGSSRNVFALASASGVPALPSNCWAWLLSTTTGATAGDGAGAAGTSTTAAGGGGNGAVGATSITAGGGGGTAASTGAAGTFWVACWSRTINSPRAALAISASWALTSSGTLSDCDD